MKMLVAKVVLEDVKKYHLWPRVLYHVQVELDLKEVVQILTKASEDLLKISNLIFEVEYVILRREGLLSLTFCSRL